MASASVAAAAPSSARAASRSSLVTDTGRRERSSSSSLSLSRISAALLPRAKLAAERTSPASSAPLKSSVLAARDSSSWPSTKAKASAERASFSRMARVCILKIWRRPSRSGRSMEIWTSNLPGRLRAGSMSSGRFVRPTTRTFGAALTPSIFASNVLTTPSRTPVVSPARDPRFRATASISSKIMTCKAEASPTLLNSSSAGSKRARTFRSASPTNLSRISGPLTICGSRAPSSRASSRASNVFPQPGGPERRTPRTWSTPRRFAATGSLRDASTRRTRASSCFSRPPTDVDRLPLVAAAKLMRRFDSTFE
mmetsp:Transcript_10091/g.32942  ORF Transcript_10091/g.32942 Transcript_10091/m.32942 type:complete len:312 (-) Transcript_10091:539-1474(-)